MPPPEKKITLYRRLWLSLSVLIVLSCLSANMLSYWAYLNDDAFITFRYSLNLASGNGPYYNPGEPVEGYSNPLLMLILSGMILLFHPDAALPCAKIIGFLAGLGASAASLAIFYQLLGNKDQETHPTSCVLPAGALLAASSGFGLCAMNGLETALFACFITLTGLCSLTYQPGKSKPGYLLPMVLMIFTRPEGLALALCFLSGHLVQHQIIPQRDGAPLTRFPKALKRDFLIVGTLVIAGFLWRQNIYGGEWLPNTYWAKKGGDVRQNILPYVSDGILRPFLGFPGVFIALLGYWKSKTVIPQALPCLMVLGGGICLPWITGADWMPGWRFVIPYLPLAVALIPVGWILFLNSFSFLKGVWIPIILGVIFTFFGIQEIRHHNSFHNMARIRARGYQEGHLALAEWIRKQSNPNTPLIALMDIGMIGYSLIDYPILDITGLTDAFIAKSPGTFFKKRYDPTYVLQKKPQFIILTFYAKRNTELLPGAKDLKHFSLMEKRLYENQEFKASYLSRPDIPSGNPLERQIMEKWGAGRVFEHLHPHFYYFLLVFEYNENINKEESPLKLDDSL